MSSPSVIESGAHLARPRIWRRGAARDTLATLAIGVCLFVLVQLALPQSIVEGRSMQPGLKEGQRVLISRLNYMFGDPEYGDIVVFNSPAPLADDEPPLIKRVVGLPGDVVEFRDTLLYVNDRLIDEPYINEDCTRFQCPDRRWELGPDEYFVLGDNRNASRDSRAFDAVARHLIIGQALLRVWPPSHVEILDRYQ